MPNLFKKYDREKHKQGLIELYTDQLKKEEGFMEIVLTRAINSLNAGCKPEAVEDWVVTMEKNWRKFLPK